MTCYRNCGLSGVGEPSCSLFFRVAVMTINDLWYFGMFLWGLMSAWAVIKGLSE